MKNIYNLLFIIILTGFVSNIYPQDYTNPKMNPEMKGYKIKGYFQITPLGGFIVPMFVLSDNYYTSGNAGFDLSYRINRETALFFESHFNFLSPVDSLAPSSSYLIFGVGSRFYWRARGVRSSFCFEAATGPYIHFFSSYTTPQGSFASSTEFNWGGNAGFGGEIVLTNSLFFTLKGKYNAIFSNKGTMSFICGQSGLSIRL